MATYGKAQCAKIAENGDFMENNVNSSSFRYRPVAPLFPGYRLEESAQREVLSTVNDLNGAYLHGKMVHINTV